MPSCFPTPHTDSANTEIDLNEILNVRKNSCFLFRVGSDEMLEAGIYRDDIVVVDKSMDGKHGNIVLVIVDGKFSIRRLVKRGHFAEIESGDGSLVELPACQEVVIWGVVTCCLRRLI